MRTKVLFIGDIHFKLFSSFSPFNRADKEFSFTTELARAVKSIRWVGEVIEKENPDLVIQLGDVFHSLHQTPNLVFAVATAEMRKLYERHDTTEFWVIGGNHDIVSDGYSLITGIPWDRVFTHREQEEGFDVIPYIDNPIELKNQLQNPEEKIVLTHATIKGFLYNRAKTTDDGVEVSKDAYYISGHVHIPQQKRNVLYVGSLYQNAISELPHDIPNGVWVAEIENGEIKELRHIPNTAVGNIISVKLSEIGTLEDLLTRYKVDGAKIVNDLTDPLEAKELIDEVTEILKSHNPDVAISITSKPKRVVKAIKELPDALDVKELITSYIAHKHPNLKDLVVEFLLKHERDLKGELKKKVEEITENLEFGEEVVE